jgi:CRP/FNR family cyclic AMP-dependent transcriptional regulator
MDEIDFLKKFDVFQDLEEEEIKQLVKNARKLSFKNGEAIINEGETGSSMYILLKGEVQIIRTLCITLPDEQCAENDKVLSHFKEDQHVIFGEVGLLQQEQRSATIRALSNSTILELSSDDFFDFAQKYPELGFKVLLRISRNLCNYLRKSNDDVVKLTTALSLALSY